MKKVIAIVEDEKDLNELVKRYLEKEGYEVRSYLTYEEASAHTSDDDVHCWILDIMLDDKSGFDLIEEIRMQSPEVPVVFMSARDKEFDRIIGLEKGSDDYITKPFSPSEMVARVKAHMARYERLVGSGQPANEIIEIRGLKIDKTARRVWVNGEEKTFTTKEFDLLSFLAQNPNHVFTKEELFSKIWDMESIGDIATVTVHIKKIREKIEFNTAKPQYIETIWGVGYRFKI